METARSLTERLRRSPDLDEFRTIATEFEALPNYGRAVSETLEVYMAICEFHILETFATHEQGSLVLTELFSTPVGISCLISRLKSARSLETQLVIQTLENVLRQPNILAKLLQSSSNEAQSLLCGSRVLAAVSEHNPQSWLGDSRQYTSWLARQILNNKITDPKIFDRSAKLGSPQYLCSPFLESPESLQQLAHIYRQLRPAQQRFLVSHAFRHLVRKMSVGQGSRLLADLGVSADMLTDLCMRLQESVHLVRIAIVLARFEKQLLPLTNTVGREWSSRSTIECRSLLAQQTMTQFLIASAASMDSATAKQYAHSSILSAGVTARLESTSARVRNLGTLVAEVFAKQAGAKLEFGIEYKDYQWWIGVDMMCSSFHGGSHARNSEQEESGQLNPSLTTILQPATNADSDDEPQEARDLDDDDDESDEEIPPLFYVKDLVAYLRSDKYGEVYSALSAGPKLIARKAQFGSEVSHYSEELLTSACGLNDKFSITNFANMRQALLNAVVIADFEKTPQLVVKLFVTGDWSLSQRQSLLASLVYAGHTLANGGQETEHEKLPGALHELFMSPQDRLLTHATTKATAVHGSELSNGIITRRSRKLDPGTPAQPLPKNRFSPISDKFFYPLFAAKPPLRPSSYDAIVYAQWLRTLGTFVAECYPSQHLPGMLNELWPLLKSLVLNSSLSRHEIIIQEAIYSCLGILINVAGGLIVQSFAADIGPILDAVALALSSGGLAQNPETQKSGRLALAALADLAKTIENRILGDAIVNS